MWCSDYVSLCAYDNKGSENKTLVGMTTVFFNHRCPLNCCGQIYSNANHDAKPANIGGYFVWIGLFTFGQKNSSLCEVT